MATDDADQTMEAPVSPSEREWLLSQERQHDEMIRLQILQAVAPKLPGTPEVAIPQMDVIFNWVKGKADG